jgi:hypothetical protein
MNPVPLIRCLAGAALLFAAGSAQAAWYQVEVIVFRHLDTQSDGETWFEPEIAPERGDALDLVAGAADTAAGLVPFQRTGGSLLGGVWQSMRNSPVYRPLLHQSWQQPDRDGGGTRAVRLELGGAAADASGTLSGEPPVVQGNVRIRAARLLYADVDVALLADGTPGVEFPADDPARRYLRVRESRKLKLNELHYFDHPLFGVLLQVSRLQAEPAAAAAN